METKNSLNSTELEEISSKELDILRGGIAKCLSEESLPSVEGDGAKYVCCIKVGKLS